MQIQRRPVRASIAVLTACSLAVAQLGPVAFAQTAPPKPAPAATPTAPGPDGGWPRDTTTPSGDAIRIFQPQIASWEGQKKMVAYSAVAFNAKGATKPAMGTVKLEANTSVAVNERLVNFSDLKVTESNFAGMANDQQKEVVGQIVSLVPKGQLVLGLDRVLARLDKSQVIPKNVDGIKADPPPIFYSTTKSVLMNLDGDPIWSPIKGNDLKFAVNTNWDLFQHTPTNAYYVRYNQSWLTTTDVVKGEWKPTTKLPDSFKTLPDENGNWKDVKAAVPGHALESSQVPKVFVSTKPAEMINLTGAPNYQLVQGTNLLWVSNSDADLFRLGKGGTVYFLVSGRWFSAPDFTGPWTFATLNLPEDFKKIPLSHPRSNVLASVPGTDQAAEAVLLAQIPQTAAVSKKTVKAPEVNYDGQPQFQPIEKTTVSRAVNTDKDIIKVGDLYYMCTDGVWFMSKSPTGPWEVTGNVPGQIYEIPISSPAHNVTYVTVEEDNSDEVVFATAMAATGMMIAFGCVVWGSGYYYPPYVGYGGFYPMYYPYYPTYGYRASYNPWTGAYSRGVVAYGPYGGAGVGARYNPRTGTYARGAAAWGPYGGRGAATAYNPRTGAVGATRQGSNVYGSWGQTGVRRGDDWATTSRVTNNRTGNTTRVTRGSEGGAAVSRNPAGPGGGGTVARTGSGDVYAGRDGNVYRKQEGGGWQQYGDGGWNNVNKPTPTAEQQQRANDARANASTARSNADSSTVGQLNRDSAARAEGQQRTRDYSNSGRTGSSSYRPSGGISGGGMSRGGGGRRR
jgi:hypothetical protein